MTNYPFPPVLLIYPTPQTIDFSLCISLQQPFCLLAAVQTLLSISAPFLPSGCWEVKVGTDTSLHFPATLESNSFQETLYKLCLCSVPCCFSMLNRCGYSPGFLPAPNKSLVCSCCVAGLCGIPRLPVARIPLIAELPHFHWGSLSLPEQENSYSSIRKTSPTVGQSATLL